VQYFQTGTSGTDFNISSTTATHTFNIPDASATARGLITTGTQTINGQKNFESGINIKQGIFPLNLGYTGIGAQTNGLIINVTGGGFGVAHNLLFNTATPYIYTFPSASGTIALTSDLGGYVTLATTQTITGYKTFDAALELKYNVIPTPSSAGYIGIGSNGVGITITTKPVSTVYNNNFYFASASNTFTFPNATGTLALTSDLANYVDLTTAQTISGAKTFSSSVVNDDGLKIKFGSATNLTASYLTLSAYGLTGPPALTVLRIGLNATYFAQLFFPNTNSYQYTFPSAFGTLALTSDLSGYLPLAGGTLTGALGGTSATFSSTLRVNGGITTIYDASEARLNLNTNIDGEQNSGWLYADSNATLGSIGNVHIQALSTTVLSVLDYNVYGNNGSNGAVGNVYIGTSVAQGTNNGAVLSLGGWTTSTGSPSAFGRIAGRKENATSGNQAGYLSFETANALVSQSTEKMRITSIGNVLIGTTTDAGYKLDVNGTGRFSSSVTGGAFLSSGTGYDTATSAEIQLNNTTASTGRAFVLNSFNSGGFQIADKTAGGATRFSISSTGAATFNSSVQAVNLGLGYAPQTGIGAFIYKNSADYNVVIQQDGSGIPFQITTLGSIRMLVTNGGNVGIGTSSPVSIGGHTSLTINGSSICRLDQFVGGTSIGLLYSSASFTMLQTSGANPLQFGTNDTERMRITPGGTLNYNIASNTDVADQYHPGISFSVENGGTLFQATNTTASVIQTRFANPNGNVGSITTSGVSTSYNPSSDRRLKENIKPIENAIEKVLKLKPVSYTWIKTGESDDGFIAQDLLEIDYFKHRVNPIGEAEDGTDLYGVDYMRFVSILTAAIQEQQAQIQELKAEIDTLKNK
jgi:hypothetical protein